MSKILIVDDERQVIQQIATLLTGLGYEHGFIPKPEFLFQRLESEVFDLILLDINMPGVDGIHLLKEIKENPKYKGIAVIMMTGESDDKYLARCFENGADDFIGKPIKELIFNSRVKAVLDKQNYIKQINHQQKLLNEQIEEITSQKELLFVQNNDLEEMNANITASISYAKIIQTAMLPPLENFHLLFKEGFVLFKPKDIVSGDFYWIAEVDEKIVITAADCTGHGVPGAFMSLVGNGLLNKIVKEQKVLAPDKILDMLHQEVRETLNQDHNQNRDGMDIALCVIDKKNNILEYAGAYSPLIIIQKDELKTIKGDLDAIGGFQKKVERSFVKHTIDISQETVIYLFSDGYKDQFGGAEGKKFMSTQFREVLFKIHKEPMEKQKQILEETLDTWMQGGKQHDDILILGIKF